MPIILFPIEGEQNGWQKAILGEFGLFYWGEMGKGVVI
jgi:hypothetical protein